MENQKTMWEVVFEFYGKNEKIRLEQSVYLGNLIPWRIV